MDLSWLLCERVIWGGGNGKGKVQNSTLPISK